MTYFRKTDQQKFFNPLTLVLLPTIDGRVAENIKEKGLHEDQEIIEDPNYRVFRNDRSQVSHSADPNNPKKFRKNGKF